MAVVGIRLGRPPWTAPLSDPALRGRRITHSATRVIDDACRGNEQSASVDDASCDRFSRRRTVRLRRPRFRANTRVADALLRSLTFLCRHADTPCLTPTVARSRSGAAVAHRSDGWRLRVLRIRGTWGAGRRRWEAARCAGSAHVGTGFSGRRTCRNIGPLELTIGLAIALLVLGSQRLPLARLSLGQAIGG